MKTESAQSSAPDLPDMQNRGEGEILGARVPLLQVGISNFRLPLRFLPRTGAMQRLETSVTGTVSLAADAKGINMSRIMRVFYEFEESACTPELLESILQRYRERLGSLSARLKLDFNYPLRPSSLRSGLSGWQYYRSAYEGWVDPGGDFRRIIYFDFVYSSACPCSEELAEHARQTRRVPAIAHSQRSVARLKVEVAPGALVALEDLQAHCIAALSTETQVMVKREDEQAFAELNGAQPKFVEDAARLLFAPLDADARIADFQITCIHLESLHSHDAVAVVTKGIAGGFSGEVDDFSALRL
jgi:GTP cyclohydrolase I